jgi:DNA-binding protein Fis
MRNWVPLSFCDPNDILDLSAFKSISNTSNDSLPEKVEQNLIKYISLKISFNGERIKNILNHQIEKEILDKIIDKFDVNYITKKDFENVSVFKSKVKRIRNKKSENNEEEKNKEKEIIR